MINFVQTTQWIHHPPFIAGFLWEFTVKPKGNHNPLCHVHVLICRRNETMISFDYHWIKKSLCKPIKCNRTPALHRRAAMACVAPRRRRHGNSVSGHATECLSVFSTVCHFICGVAPERHAESWVFQKYEKEGEKGGERMRWRKGGRERKQMKRGLLSPEGLKQNRETEGLCFLFLNGLERRGRQRRRELALTNCGSYFWNRESCSLVHCFSNAFKNVQSCRVTSLGRKVSLLQDFDSLRHGFYTLSQSWDWTPWSEGDSGLKVTDMLH